MDTMRKLALMLAVIFLAVFVTAQPPELPTVFYGRVADSGNGGIAVTAVWNDVNGNQHTTTAYTLSAADAGALGDSSLEGYYFFNKGKVLAASGTMIMIRAEGAEKSVSLAASPGGSPVQVSEALVISGSESAGGIVSRISKWISNFFFSSFESEGVGAGSGSGEGSGGGSGGSGGGGSPAGEGSGEGYGSGGASGAGSSRTATSSPKETEPEEDAGESGSGESKDDGGSDFYGVIKQGGEIPENASPGKAGDEPWREILASKVKVNASSSTVNVNLSDNRNESNATAAEPSESSDTLQENKEEDKVENKAEEAKVETASLKESGESAEPVRKDEHDRKDIIESESTKESPGWLFWLMIVIYVLLAAIVLSVVFFFPVGVTVYADKRDTQRKLEGMLATLVKDVMTENVFCVKEMEKLSDILPLMDEQDLNSVCVVRKSELIGMLSERDILMKVTELKGIRVRDVLTVRRKHVKKDASIYEGGDMMIKEKLRKLPVVANGELVGIITQSDILKHLFSENVTDGLVNPSSVAIVSYIMRRHIVTVHEGASAEETVAAMRSSKSDYVIIMRDRNPVGIFTEKDFLHYMASDFSKLKSAKIDDIMSKPVFTISGDTDVLDASANMRQKGYRRLAVIEDKRMQGMLTQNELFREIYSLFVGHSSKKFKKDVGKADDGKK